MVATIANSAKAELSVTLKAHFILLKYIVKQICGAKTLALIKI